MMKYENGYLCMYSLLMPTSWRILFANNKTWSIYLLCILSIDFVIETRWWTVFSQMMLLFLCTVSNWQVWLDLHLKWLNPILGSCVEAVHTRLRQVRFDNLRRHINCIFFFDYIQHNCLYSVNFWPFSQYIKCSCLCWQDHAEQWTKSFQLTDTCKSIACKICDTQYH